MKILGCDAAGNVLLVNDDCPVPAEWNGAPITPYELTQAQEDAFNALPPNGGIVFDGTTFTTLPPIPFPVSQPSQLDILQAALIDNGVISETQLTNAQSSITSKSV